jgi:hypothetical protein
VSPAGVSVEDVLGDGSDGEKTSRGDATGQGVEKTGSAQAATTWEESIGEPALAFDGSMGRGRR